MADVSTILSSHRISLINCRALIENTSQNKVCEAVGLFHRIDLCILYSILGVPLLHEPTWKGLHARVLALIWTVARQHPIIKTTFHSYLQFLPMASTCTSTFSLVRNPTFRLWVFTDLCSSICFGSVRGHTSAFEPQSLLAFAPALVVCASRIILRLARPL